MPSKKQIKAHKKALALSEKKLAQQQSGGLVKLGKQQKPTWRKSTNDQFVEELKKSFIFWKDKALIKL